MVLGDTPTPPSSREMDASDLLQLDEADSVAPGQGRERDSLGTRDPWEGVDTSSVYGSDCEILPLVLGPDGKLHYLDDDQSATSEVEDASELPSIDQPNSLSTGGSGAHQPPEGSGIGDSNALSAIGAFQTGTITDTAPVYCRDSTSMDSGSKSVEDAVDVGKTVDNASIEPADHSNVAKVSAPPLTLPDQGHQPEAALDTLISKGGQSRAEPSVALGTHEPLPDTPAAQNAQEPMQSPVSPNSSWKESVGEQSYDSPPTRESEHGKPGHAIIEEGEYYVDESDDSDAEYYSKVMALPRIGRDLKFK